MSKNRIHIDLDWHEQIKDKYCKILNTQNGSRFLQKLLFQTKQEVIKLLYLEIEDNLHILFTKEYSNYFCSKLYSVCNHELKLCYLRTICSKILFICLNNFGIYPFQNIIELFETENEVEIMINGFKILNGFDLFILSSVYYF